jgi:hypothetical protein
MQNQVPKFGTSKVIGFKRMIEAGSWMNTQGRAPSNLPVPYKSGGCESGWPIAEPAERSPLLRVPPLRSSVTAASCSKSPQVLDAIHPPYIPIPAPRRRDRSIPVTPSKTTRGGRSFLGEEIPAHLEEERQQGGLCPVLAAVLACCGGLRLVWDLVGSPGPSPSRTGKREISQPTALVSPKLTAPKDCKRTVLYICSFNLRIVI